MKRLFMSLEIFKCLMEIQLLAAVNSWLWRGFGWLFIEVSLKKSFECLAVTSLIASHLYSLLFDFLARASHKVCIFTSSAIWVSLNFLGTNIDPFFERFAATKALGKENLAALVLFLWVMEIFCLKAYCTDTTNWTSITFIGIEKGHLI